jgi:biopolymer transport protein ExbD
MTMEFAPPPKRPRGESNVPMLNVVFLLLVFFLMTSQLTPPEPFAVSPPTAGEPQQAQAEPVVYVDASGMLAMNDLRGQQVIQTLAAQPPETLRLRADAQTPARQIARILAQLASVGVTGVELVVTGQ